MSHSSRPRGLYSPLNSPGQNTGVGSCSLLQQIFPIQGLNPHLLCCRWIPFCLSHQGSPDWAFKLICKFQSNTISYTQNGPFSFCIWENQVIEIFYVFSYDHGVIEWRVWTEAMFYSSHYFPVYYLIQIPWNWEHKTIILSIFVTNKNLPFLFC